MIININDKLYEYPHDFKAIALTPENKTITLYHPKYPRNENGQVGAIVIVYKDIFIQL